MKKWYGDFDDFDYQDWGWWWGGSRDKDVKRLSRLRDELSRSIEQPFLSDIIYGLKPVAMEVLPNGRPNQSCATDGRTLAFNPDYIRGKTDENLKWILAHEAGHVALYHPFRRGERHELLWNIAADYSVNPLLAETMKLPADTLYEEGFKGWSVEKIYDFLDKNKKQRKLGGKTLEQLMQEYDEAGTVPQELEGGGVMDPTDGKGQKLSAREMRELQSKQGTENAKAKMAAKQAGKMPAGFERQMDKDIQHEPLSWEELLNRVLVRSVKTDFTWKRPNRRLLSQGFYLPTLKEEGVGELVVCIDTSGSIDSKTLAKFSKELNKILETVKPQIIHCISCDAAVHDHLTFNNTEEVTMPTSGGGGTSFVPPFRKLQEEGIEPMALIYFTDLCCNDYPDKPKFPVIWAATGKHSEPPFGETILLKG